ncbi:MAG: DUF4384 domain-containing protein [Myxococcales bacterium]|nr:DUF4384 domain-containing protein [Myxococcales bacterium]
MEREQKPDASLQTQAALLAGQKEDEQIEQEILRQGLEELDQMVNEGPFALLRPDPEEIPSAPASLQRLESFLLRRDEETQAAQAAQATKTDAMPGLLASFQKWMSRSSVWMGPVVGVAAILVALPFVLPTNPNKVGQPPLQRDPAPRDRDLVGKGEIALHVDMLRIASTQTKQGNDIRPALVTSRQVLHPGDFVQFRYSAPKTLHMMIVSLNSKGEVFAFLPFQGSQSTQVQAGQKRTLPAESSYELDDYLGWERFFLVASERPFAFAALKTKVLQAYKRASNKVERVGSIEGSWLVFTMLVKKAQRTRSAEPLPR